MASDLSNNRFLVLMLFLSVCVLGYYYYDASSVATSLYNEAEKLRAMMANANKTVAEMRTEIEGCKAQLKVIEEERNKVKTDVEAKDKEIAAKAAAEKTAKDQAETLKKEKATLENQMKEVKDNLEKCTKECNDKVEKAQKECKPNKSDAAAAPAQQATT